jgi:hypothetical protein
MKKTLAESANHYMNGDSIVEAEDTSMYIVTAKVFGKEKDQISVPMTKEDADSWVENLKKQMEKVVDEYRWATEIKVTKYKGEDLSMPSDTDKK